MKTEIVEHGELTVFNCGCKIPNFEQLNKYHYVSMDIKICDGHKPVITFEQLLKDLHKHHLKKEEIK